MHIIDTIFGTSETLSVAQECARAALVFAYGLLLVRIAGRRVFGKWTALDIVASIIVGSNLSRTLTGNAPLFGTLVATALLMLLHWTLAALAARWPAFSRLVEGRAVDLANGGKLRIDRLKAHAVSDADLAEALRQSDIEAIENTRKVTLEPSGKISVLKKS